MTVENRGRREARFNPAEHTPLPSRFIARRPLNDGRLYEVISGILTPGKEDHRIRVGDEIHPINSPEDLDELGRDFVDFYRGLNLVVLEDGFQIGQRIIRKAPRQTVLTVDLVRIVSTVGESGSIINPKVDISQGDSPFNETIQVDFSGTPDPTQAYFTPFQTQAATMGQRVGLAMHVEGNDPRSGTLKGRN